MSLKTVDSVTAVMENHIADNIILARFMTGGIRTNNGGEFESAFYRNPGVLGIRHQLYHQKFERKMASLRGR